VGAVVFIGIGVWYPFLSNLNQHWAAYVTISGIPILVGVLFLLNWIKRDRTPEGPAAA
jgi:hypothetical protein